jgi:hypothetical protein
MIFPPPASKRFVVARPMPSEFPTSSALCCNETSLALRVSAVSASNGCHGDTSLDSVTSRQDGNGLSARLLDSRRRMSRRRDAPVDAGRTKPKLADAKRPGGGMGRGAGQRYCQSAGRRAWERHYQRICQRPCQSACQCVWERPCQSLYRGVGESHYRRPRQRLQEKPCRRAGRRPCRRLDQ